MVAIALSCITSLTSFQGIDLLKLIQLQEKNTDLQNKLSFTTLKLRIKQIRTGKETLLCDTSIGRGRPIMPKYYWRNVFNTLNKFYHPGVSATIKLVEERFCWLGMNDDVMEWTSFCVICQEPKVIRQNKCPLGFFTTLNSRFNHIQLDSARLFTRFKWILLPLNVCWTFHIMTRSGIHRGHPHCAVVERCVESFGCPSTITKDRGRLFESKRSHYLDIRFRTATYHPQSSGLVGRFHQLIEASLSTANASQSTDSLPFVVLSILSAV